MALKVRERAPADLDEALATAMHLEAWANDVRRQPDTVMMVIDTEIVVSMKMETMLRHITVS